MYNQSVSDTGTGVARRFAGAIVKTSSLFLGYFLAVLFSSNVYGAPNTYKLTELTHSAQGAPAPAKVASIRSFASNNNKQVAFIGDDGLFERALGHTSLLAALGTGAPGGGKFLAASDPAINQTGQVVFRGETAMPNSSGLFLYSAGNISQVVADGTLSTSGDVLYPTTPSINDSGTIVFLGFNRNGIFVSSNGAVHRLVVPGDAAPDSDIFIDFQSCSINQRGDIVFRATLLSGNTGIFLASGTTTTKVAATGDFLNGGVIFTFLGDVSFNDLGQVVVAGLANGPASSSGVYLFTNGSLTVAVPDFSPLPTGGTLTLITDAALNDSGQIALLSQTSNDPGGRTGVFVSSGGSLSQIMVPGQVLPGGDALTSTFGLSLDEAGRVVFLSRALQHNDALFRWNAPNLFRIAEQGDSVAAKPAFIFPTAYGLSSGRVLVFSNTFPGGIGLFSAGKADASDVKLVAHVGQKLGNQGVIQGFFENFEISAKGDVIFNSDLSGGHSIIFHKAPGQYLTPIVRASFDGSGDISPDGTPFLGVREVSITSNGRYGFVGFTAAQSGIYLSDHGVISLAVDNGALLPDGSGPLGSVSSHALNEQGQIAFFAQPFPLPNGIFFSSGGQFISIARDGDAAPGGGDYSLPYPDATFGPALSSSGSIAFAADLSTGGRALFASAGSIVNRIVGPGDPVPGGGTFLMADSPRLNSLGQVAFSGVLTDGSVGAFVFAGGALSRVAAAGDAALPGVDFVYIGAPLINDLGEIAFGAELSDGTVATFLATPVTVSLSAQHSSQSLSNPRQPVGRGQAYVVKAKLPRPLRHGNRWGLTQ